MKDSKESAGRKVDLGRCGSATFFLSADHKSLLVAFDVRPEGFDKTGVNEFVYALEKIRKSQTLELPTSARRGYCARPVDMGGLHPEYSLATIRQSEYCGGQVRPILVEVNASK